MMTNSFILCILFASVSRSWNRTWVLTRPFFHAIMKDANFNFQTPLTPTLEENKNKLWVIIASSYLCHEKVSVPDFVVGCPPSTWPGWPDNKSITHRLIWFNHSLIHVYDQPLWHNHPSWRHKIRTNLGQHSNCLSVWVSQSTTPM